MNCKSHPEKLATYLCLACKSHFCDTCVSVRKVTQDFTAYVCLACGGKCDSLAELEKEAKKKEFKFPFLGKKENNTTQESKKPAEKFALKPFFQKTTKTPSAKKETKPLSENFWLNLLSAPLFPLKGFGVAHVISNAGILFC